MRHLEMHLLPLLVSALIQWFLGALWYSPVLFVKPWLRLLKITPGGEKKGLVPGMISSLIGSFILSFVLLHAVDYAGATTYAFGAFIGFLNWLGFIAAPNFAQGIYEQRPIGLFIINAGYWLVGLTITGGLLAVWH